MDEFRDTELGKQLEVLVEPDHGPDYWDRMRAHVAEEAAGRRQRPAFARRVRAALGRRRLRVVIVAAALVAAVAAAILTGLPRTPGPEAVSAAAVLKRALSAVSTGRTWQADVRDEGRGLEQVGGRVPLRRLAVPHGAEHRRELPADAARPDSSSGVRRRHEPARDRRCRLRRFDRHPPSPQAGAEAVGGPRRRAGASGPLAQPAHRRRLRRLPAGAAGSGGARAGEDGDRRQAGLDGDVHQGYPRGLPVGLRPRTSTGPSTRSPWTRGPGSRSASRSCRRASSPPSFTSATCASTSRCPRERSSCVRRGD